MPRRPPGTRQGRPLTHSPEGTPAPAAPGGRRRGRRWFAAAGCTAALLAPAGPLAPGAAAEDGDGGKPNGVERLDPGKVAAKARSALLGADSLRLRLDDRGEAGSAGNQLTAMDLRLDTRGDCRGSLTLGGGGSVTMVKRGDEIWMKPDRAFWRGQLQDRGDAMARKVHGRYVHGTTRDSLLSPLAGACDLDGFRHQLTDGAGGRNGGPPAYKGRPTQVGGVEALPLVREQKGTANTLYVATRGRPYPVQLTQRGPGADVRVRLTEYQRPVHAQPPPTSSSVDVAVLENRVHRV
ncbi:hypothetical protein [Streptomyces sp. NPDC058045]|uniref:hypothetical protein n=1 Tax=Streptomyces sp. NPDC058045 TaxID=3346311 RepID=UPI0036E6351D